MNEQLQRFYIENKGKICFIFGLIVFLTLYGIYMQSTTDTSIKSEGQSASEYANEGRRDISESANRLQSINTRLDTSVERINQVQTRIDNVQEGLGQSTERINTVKDRTARNNALIAEGRDLIRASIKLIQEESKSPNESKDTVSGSIVADDSVSNTIMKK